MLWASSRDRVVQGALKLILEPIFEAGFHDGSYGYRPTRKAHDALARVTKAILEGKTQVIDLDLAAYFDTVRHDLLAGKVARRVQDGEILRLLKLMLKASGKRGVPRGGVILGVDGRATSARGPRELGPVLAEATPLPSQDGVGRHDDQRLSPASPDSGEPDPEEAIRRTQSGPRYGSSVHGELLAQREVLQGELTVAAAEEGQQTEQVE
jgi:hypothetical protein